MELNLAVTDSCGEFALPVLQRIYVRNTRVDHTADIPHGHPQLFVVCPGL
jgi:hypothetical protein